MAVATVAVEGGLFAVWGKPTVRDVDRVAQEMREGVAMAGHPILYVTRVPEYAPAPDPDVRRYLNSQMGLAGELCSTYHVVLEGSGFTAAMKRAVLVALFQVAGKRRTFFVHSLPEEIYGVVRGDDLSVARQLLKQAKWRRLLDGDPAPVWYAA